MPKSKKKQLDQSYTPRMFHTRRKHKPAKNNTQGNVMALRTKKSRTAIDDSGEMKPLKTTALITSELIVSSHTPNRLAKKIKANFQKIETFTPVKKIVKRSKTGSVLKVKSKSGAVMKRVLKAGTVSIFSTDADNLIVDSNTPTKNPNDKTEFEKSPGFSILKDIENQLEKKQSYTISTDLLRNSRNENAKLKKRSKSQKQIMKQSAKDHVEEVQILAPTNMKWEWLHLVAHSIGGDKKTQKAENLVAGSNHANTNMLFIEGKMDYLSKHFPDGFELEVSATLHPDSHIATKIKYTIKTKDLIIPFEFDPMATNKPHIIFSDYFQQLLVSYIEKNPDNNEQRTPDHSPSIIYHEKNDSTSPATPLWKRK